MIASRSFAFCPIRLKTTEVAGLSNPRKEAVQDLGGLVRAPSCPRKALGSWKVAHQHISKPIQVAGVQ
jgi:hypothetical protein